MKPPPRRAFPKMREGPSDARSQRHKSRNESSLRPNRARSRWHRRLHGDRDAHVTSKMQRCFGLFCVSLVFCAALSETIGLVIAAKEKRGWTLNSAGYLLGPRRIDHLIQIKDAPSARGRDELVTQYGIDGHRTLGDKPGLAGKRDMGQEEDFRTGALRIADEDIIHTVIDFLSYLRLKEMGALDSLPSSATSDELANA
ncbi:hypothetical protein Q5P01_011979 [Channa striata]|uniref:Galanin peptides n=1 Tax=Channa striata TaxID=64152 RepID=A0AA88SQK9_CHASR|nr:hypothetical protein Q5P01_011979 [Channa striata]